MAARKHFWVQQGLQCPDTLNPSPSNCLYTFRLSSCLRFHFFTIVPFLFHIKVKECIPSLPGKDSFRIFIRLLSDSLLVFYILLGVLLDDKQSGSDSLGNKIHKSDLVLASQAGS